MADAANEAREALADLDRARRLLARKLERAQENLALTTLAQRSNARMLESLMAEIEEARKASDDLLRNILPESAIARLARGETTIADDVPAASVIFADFVGFTPISARLSARQLVEALNGFYSAFDDEAARQGVEKIKTIGDAYLAVAGLGGEDDHADRAAAFALRMQDLVAASPARASHDWRIRVGIHAGPLTAIVIGKRKFAYDVWGDAVNVASRVQDACEAGAVTASGDAAALLSPRFALANRRTVELKGRGARDVFDVTLGAG